VCPYEWDRRETVCYQTYDKWWPESRIQGPSEEDCVTKATRLPVLVWSPTLGSLYHWVPHATCRMKTLSQPFYRLELTFHAPPYSLHDSARLLEIPVFGGQLPDSPLLLVMSMLFIYFFFETESMHLWSMRFFWSLPCECIWFLVCLRTSLVCLCPHTGVICLCIFVVCFKGRVFFLVFFFLHCLLRLQSQSPLLLCHGESILIVFLITALGLWKHACIYFYMLAWR